MADEKLLKKFLTNHPHFELFKDEQGREKVKCKLTGHELPSRLSDLESYTRGKKYQRLIKEVPVQSPGYEEYKEFLKPSEKKRYQLFCELTKKYINNAPHHIQRHVTGKRFMKALQKHYEQKSLDEERTEEEEMMWVPSDLESDSEDGQEMIIESTNRDTFEHEVSLEGDKDFRGSQDQLKRTSQDAITEKPRKMTKITAEAELEKKTFKPCPKKPKAKRSKAS